VALIEAANSAAGRTKDTYLRAQYLRIKRRHGHKKATVAVAHSILVSAYHVLAEGRPYDELGGDSFLRREDRERIAKTAGPPSSNAYGTALRWNPWPNRRGEQVFLSRTWSAFATSSKPGSGAT
jgi:hypothetical protein